MVGIEKFDISQRQPAGAATLNKLRSDATLTNARPMGSQNFPKSLGWICCCVLVQPGERALSANEYSALRAETFKASGFTDPIWFL